jgi:hypothetical protein
VFNRPLNREFKTLGQTDGIGNMHASELEKDASYIDLNQSHIDVIGLGQHYTLVQTKDIFLKGWQLPNGRWPRVVV